MILKLRPDTDHPLYISWRHVVRVSDSKLLLSTGDEVDLEPGEAEAIIDAVVDSPFVVDEMRDVRVPGPKGRKKGR